MDAYATCLYSRNVHITLSHRRRSEFGVPSDTGNVRWPALLIHSSKNLGAVSRSGSTASPLHSPSFLPPFKCLLGRIKRPS
ncbi:hypothetical protein J6590_051950, partial [Homalodisca vitripennis]